MPEMPEILKKAISDDNNRTDEVYGNSAFTMEELQPNHIMLADEELLDMVYDDLVRGK
ncbi:MAG: hypothetical protein LUD07_06255 [Clostridiales bacterium]|nr:hypothetical protein [Clostridiales bacterium]